MTLSLKYGRYLFPLLGLLLLCSFGQAQIRYHKHFDAVGVKYQAEVDLTSDEGWVIVASSDELHPNNVDGIVAMRFDPVGNLLWTRFFYHPGIPLRFSSMLVDANDRIVITGYVNGTSDGDVFLAQLDASGTLNWARSYAGDYGEYIYSVAEHAGGYAVFGNSLSINGGNGSSNFLLNTDFSGNVVWNNTYFQSGIWGRMISTSDGGFMCRNGSDIFKVAANGTIQWRNRYTVASYAGPPVEVSDGYVFPFYDSSHQPGWSYLYKLDDNGNVMWTGDAYPAFRTFHIKQRPNGNLITIGTEDNNGTNVLSLNEFSSSGALIRTNRFYNDPNGANYEGFDLELFADGSALAIAGSGNYPSRNLFMIRTNDDLEVGCGDLPQNIAQPAPPVTATPQTATSSPVNFTVSQELILHQWLNPVLHTDCYSCDSVDLALGNDTILCAAAPVTLGATTEDASWFLWSTGDTSQTVQVQPPGVFWAEAGNICHTARDTIVIDAYPLLTPAIQASQLEGSPFDDFRFSHNTPDAVDFWWELDNGLIRSEADFEHRFDQNGIHTVYLTVEDSNQCFYSDSVDVDIKFFAHYLPNAFTPDGDGLNDAFGLLGDGVVESTLQIFNRWGNLVFEGDNALWDGTENGRNSPPGVYAYKLRIQTIYGNVTYPTGHVTLIR